jgi:hypothetical protein
MTISINFFRKINTLPFFNCINSASKNKTVMLIFFHKKHVIFIQKKEGALPTLLFHCIVAACNKIQMGQPVFIDPNYLY